CADSVRVTEWIGDAALELGRNQPAPDPTYIWLRAELARRAEAEGTSAWRRIGVAAAQGLALGGLSAAAMLAALPKVAGAVMAVRPDVSAALAQAPLVDMTVIGAVWLGFPLLLAATYLLVLRPLR